MAKTRAATGKFADKLAQGQAQYRDAKPMQFKNAPPGHYIMALGEAVMFEKKDDGSLMIRIKWIVAKGEQKGESVTEFFNIDLDTGLGMFKGRMESIDVECPESKVDLEPLCDQLTAEPPLIETTVVVRAGKNGGEFTNLTDVILADDDALGDDDDDNEPASDDDDNDPEAEADEDADEPAADDDGDEVDVGSRVSFTDGEGNEIEGEVSATDAGDDGDLLAVTDDDGNGWEIPVDEVAIVEAAAADEDADEEKQNLVTIADAHNVEVDDEQDVEDIVAAMKEHTWIASKLTDDEKAVLKEAGIAVKKSAVKKTAKKKTTTKKKTSKKKVRRSKR